jgi:hypothetical protein
MTAFQLHRTTTHNADVTERSGRVAKWLRYDWNYPRVVVVTVALTRQPDRATDVDVVLTREALTNVQM